jgi:hypothetical protein
MQKEIVLQDIPLHMYNVSNIPILFLHINSAPLNQYFYVHNKLKKTQITTFMYSNF